MGLRRLLLLGITRVRQPKKYPKRMRHLGLILAEQAGFEPAVGY